MCCADCIWVPHADTPERLRGVLRVLQHERISAPLQHALCSNGSGPPGCLLQWAHQDEAADARTCLRQWITDAQQLVNVRSLLRCMLCSGHSAVCDSVSRWPMPQAHAWAHPQTFGTCVLPSTFTTVLLLGALLSLSEQQK